MKRRRWEKYAIVVAVALITTPLFAQYTLYDAPPPKWSLFGNAGFDFAHSGLASHYSGANNLGTSTNQQLGGTVDATLEGFAFNPGFLSFTGNVSDYQGDNSSQQAVSGNTDLPGFDSRNGNLSYSASATFLAGRGKPLYVHYTKTDDGLTSTLFRNTQGTREFGATWRGKLAHLPNIGVDFRDNASDVAIPTSLYDTNHSQRFLDLTANDRIHGFNWNGTFTNLTQTIDSIGATVLPDKSNTHSLNESFNIARGFFDEVLVLRGGEQATRDRTTGSLGNIDYDLLGYNAGANYRPAGKFSAGVTFNRENFENKQFQPGTVPGVVPTLLFALPSTTTTSVNGTTEYRAFHFLTWDNGVLVNESTVPKTSEQLEKSVTPNTAVIYRDKWRGFDVNAHVGVGYTITTSNFGRNANGLSNNYGANVSRGTLQRLRWTANYQSVHQIIPQIIGAYSDSRVAGVQAETARFWNLRLLGGIDYTNTDILTVSGQFSSKGLGFNVGASRDNFGLRFFRTHNSGDGAIFPIQITTNSYLINLPLQQLVSSPLLNKTGNVTGLNGFLYWRRWLINGSLTRERDFFSQTDQEFNYINIDARYTLGKFTLDAGYSRNVLNTGTNSVWSGTNYNRYRFRVTRSFSIF